MEHHYDDGPDIVATNEKIKKKQDEITRLENKKKQLIEEEEKKNKRAIELSNRLKKLKTVRENINKAIIDTTLELNKHCTHEKIRTEHRNYPGGYLHTAEHWTDYFCEICGVKVDEKVKYGGFS